MPETRCFGSDLTVDTQRGFPRMILEIPSYNFDIYFILSFTGRLEISTSASIEATLEGVFCPTRSEKIFLFFFNSLVSYTTRSLII